MYQNKLISVVVPCYNEESQIEQVIATIPDYIDAIVVIDDVSRDNTVKVIEHAQQSNPKVVLIKHDKNQGVGGAKATGIKWSRDNNIDIAVTIDGDGQMNPSDLPLLLDPIVNNEVHFTKTNRLASGEAYEAMPKLRYFGNAMLTMLTKIVSGYWHITDSQSGYVAIAKEPLHTINWDKMYKRYGQPNDLLIWMNIHNFKVRDIQTDPIYNIGERSSMKVWKVVFTISWLLTKRFFFRLKAKYIIRDFHPLVFFYFFGFFLMAASIPLFARIIYFWIAYSHIPKVNFLAWMFAVIMGIQFILFAMWFDMDNNKHLR